MTPPPPSAVGAGPTRAARSSRRVRAAADVRQEILVSAHALFFEKGFHAVTLTEIGRPVGVTRGAVLYHFPSKVDLLVTLIEPWVVRFSALLDSLEARNPAAAPADILAEVLDVLIETRAALELLTRDVSSQLAAGASEWVNASARRLVVLLAADGAGSEADLHALAAIGALSRPFSSLTAEVTPAERAAVLRSAVAALHPPPLSLPGSLPQV